MNDVRKEELTRLSMRRELTAEEEATLENWLSGHPEARAHWEKERVLSRAIQSLPDIPLSSNFTARVLQAVELDGATETRKARSPRSWFRMWIPRFACGGFVAVLAVLGVQKWHSAEQKKLARTLVSLPIDLARLPAPDVLADFDAINELRQVSMTSDDDLLRALQ